VIASTALVCLALNIYMEARGEPVMGRYAVAMVTLNRAGDEARVCHEVFRPHQFSWTRGVQRTPAGWRLPQHLIPRLSDPAEARAWSSAKAVASVSLAGYVADFTQGARYFHAVHVSPSWAKSMRPVKRIGRHIFFVHE